jgi:hypothetical protein
VKVVSNIFGVSDGAEEEVVGKEFSGEKLM